MSSRAQVQTLVRRDSEDVSSQARHQGGQAKSHGITAPDAPQVNWSWDVSIDTVFIAALWKSMS